MTPRKPKPEVPAEVDPLPDELPADNYEPPAEVDPLPDELPADDIEPPAPVEV